MSRPLSQRAPLLWSAFFVVHVVIILLALYGPGNPLGDLAVVYRGWADDLRNGTITGITTPFVYPILAMMPISAAIVLGDAAYVYTWFLLVTLFDAAAFAVLVRGVRPQRVRVACWWLLFQLLLGPIALSRIDSVTVPVAIIGLLWLGSRPFWGTALLVLATWVKIWPAAVIAALVVVWPKRWRMLLLAAAISLGIVVVALILGSGSNVFSFVTAQTGRGIQIESPVAGIWMWLTALHVPGSSLYYDRDILTFQVLGPGVDTVSTLMTPLMALTAAVVILLGVRATRGRAAFVTVFPPLVLALTVTLIAFNKVGSPQFISWLAAPIILGLVWHGDQWRTPATLALVLASLTQLVYPYFYDRLLVADPTLVLVLTVRNLLEFVLLGWAVRELWSYDRGDERTGERRLRA
ncbi:glycosyltransferase 87 family protein [Cryobacterium sp. MLB-32]|uniref:glycosyltransferase 87 family protein n=1 Tax=Cryobacterium sp. MLB-32 TaxID=1529318 RepID=UPI00068EC0B2|nr:glycosyltransferase 87 family protein [Cryobacterium sp. MLB-32]